MAEWTRRSSVCESFSHFSQTFSQIFRTVSPVREAARSLISLRQGRCNVMDYVIKFCTLADSGCNNSALIDAFLHGLSAKVKDHLIYLDIPTV